MLIYAQKTNAQAVGYWLIHTQISGNVAKLPIAKNWPKLNPDSATNAIQYPAKD
jgi:hypothetical protein